MDHGGHAGSRVDGVEIGRRALDAAVGPFGARAFSEPFVNPRAIAKQALLKTVGAATRRHPVLLPQAAADEANLLEVVAPYRVENGELVVTIRERRPGMLTATLLAPQRPNSSRLLWRSAPLRYDGPSILRFDLSDGTVRFAERPSGEVPVPLPSRRFCWSLELQPGDESGPRSRVTREKPDGLLMICRSTESIPLRSRAPATLEDDFRIASHVVFYNLARFV